MDDHKIEALLNDLESDCVGRKASIANPEFVGEAANVLVILRRLP